MNFQQKYWTLKAEVSKSVSMQNEVFLKPYKNSFFVFCGSHVHFYSSYHCLRSTLDHVGWLIDSDESDSVPPAHSGLLIGCGVAVVTVA